MNNRALQNLLSKQVLELEFVRRHPKLGWSNIRGLFGTTNFPLLNGDFGMQVLRFEPPKGMGMGYDYRSKGLCVVWDIFRQDFRVFGSEQVTIKKAWDLDTEENVEEFSQYFYDYIIDMSNDNKLKFMGYVGMTALPTPLINKAATIQANTANYLKNKVDKKNK